MAKSHSKMSLKNTANLCENRKNHSSKFAKISAISK